MNNTPRLHSIFLEITSNCNCSCLHCRGNFDGENIKELEPEQISKLLSEAKKLGASYAIITGGEPLLHPDLLKIVETVRKKDFEILLATNGVLLDQDLAMALSIIPRLSIQISIESSRAESHDFIRGRKGLFGKAVQAAKMCSSMKIPFITSMTLTNENINDVESFIEFSKKIGAKNIKLRRFVGSGTGYRNYSLLGLNKEKIKGILELIAKPSLSLHPEVEVEVEQAPFGILFSEERNTLAALKGICIGCSAGIALCAIGPNGQFRPCPSIPISIADTNKNSLFDIWRSNSVLLELRERQNLKGKCSKCQYRQLCGGCRADAYSLSGDLFSEDPCCWYEPDRVLI